jgi:hypothetical protein
LREKASELQHQTEEFPELQRPNLKRASITSERNQMLVPMDLIVSPDGQTSHLRNLSFKSNVLSPEIDQAIKTLTSKVDSDFE